MHDSPLSAATVYDAALDNGALGAAAQGLEIQATSLFPRPGAALSRAFTVLLESKGTRVIGASKAARRAHTMICPCLIPSLLAPEGFPAPTPGSSWGWRRVATRYDRCYTAFFSAIALAAAAVILWCDQCPCP